MDIFSLKCAKNVKRANNNKFCNILLIFGDKKQNGEELVKITVN